MEQPAKEHKLAKSEAKGDEEKEIVPQKVDKHIEFEGGSLMPQKETE